MRLTDYGNRRMSRLSFLRLLALFAFLCPAGAVAAPVGAPTAPKASAQILFPVGFIKLMDMDFGLLTVAAAGTAILDSSTDAITTTGGVLVVGGSPHAARFDAVAPTRNIVKITLPKKAVTLVRVGGTETMTLDTWTLNGTGTRNVVAHEEFQFRVAGTLHVAANQAEGVYLGTFDVTLNYN